MIEYDITLSVDAGALIPSFGKLIEQVNGSMFSFGFEEKLGVRSSCLKCGLTVPRELTPEEINKVSELLLSQFKEQLPEWKVELESFKKTL